MKQNFKISFLAGFILLISFYTNPGSGSADDWSAIVDYGDPEYSETGNWATWPFGRAVGGSYRYLTKEIAGTENRKGKAFWSTQVPFDGMYRIEVSYRKTNHRTRDADYFIQDGDGHVHHFIVDQRSSEPEGTLTWNTLGVFKWYKDQVAVIELDGTDDTYSDEADAAKWVLVEKSPHLPQSDVNILPAIQLLLGHEL